MSNDIKGLSNQQLNARMVYLDILYVECVAEVQLRSKRIMKKRSPKKVIEPVKAPVKKKR